ncbi:hypothetical protein F2P81_026298 [Scophthalmus maximus]|uniref:Uncharacterized protein n=1 Tax=Scophthalmus maximus TaxID=52904 RepID=A0A6A4RMD9_SCOMX|nr:hypothetical protein F2P81_026298 [Scophthalmus maximus]
MEALLRLMLQWDPVQRGGKVNADTKKPHCFEVIEQILSMKVRKVADFISRLQHLFKSELVNQLDLLATVYGQRSFNDIMKT